MAGLDAGWVDDYNCMLNQTNIADNNNKYYAIQLKTVNFTFQVLTRWGRVGESGKEDTKEFGNDLEAAKKWFHEKFLDKTEIKWENRANFEPKAGKYTLIEVEEAEVVVTSDKAGGDAPIKKVLPSDLDSATQALANLGINENVSKEQKIKFYSPIDMKKMMPLGKLSKAQIAKGSKALQALEQAIQNKENDAKLSELSSKFYTIIPHSFGRKVPPLIDDAEKIQGKKDMLLAFDADPGPV